MLIRKGKELKENGLTLCVCVLRRCWEAILEKQQEAFCIQKVSLESKRGKFEPGTVGLQAEVPNSTKETQ